MKLNEVINDLNEGKKITRSVWTVGTYIKIKDSHLLGYRKALRYIDIVDDTLLSDDWLKINSNETDNTKKYKFYELIDYLKQGNLIKRIDWENECIFIDKSDRVLVQEYIYLAAVSLNCEDLFAEDWIVLEDNN
jgi:hypothetical protein